MAKGQKWKVPCVRMHQRYITHIDMINIYHKHSSIYSIWQMYLWYAHTHTVAASRGTILATALNPFLLSFTCEPYHQHFSKVRRFQKVIVAPLLRLGHPLARVDRKLRCQHPGSKNEALRHLQRPHPTATTATTHAGATSSPPALALQTAGVGQESLADLRSRSSMENASVFETETRHTWTHPTSHPEQNMLHPLWSLVTPHLNGK